MRLFTGIDLPDAIKERLDVLISRLRTCAHLKWSPAYNLHITTKFIGEWPEARLEELVSALESVRVNSPMEIDIRGLGWFPDPKRPRVFWAGIIAPPTLVELVKATEQALAALGIAPEQRSYAPHLTLARIKEPVPLNALRAAIESLESVDFGRFTPDHFYLYRSEPGPSGSIYSKLEKFPLPTA
jgi:RNA 2',3'-cyclic 3'-phosphodiesterase